MVERPKQLQHETAQLAAMKAVNCFLAWKGLINQSCTTYASAWKQYLRRFDVVYQTWGCSLGE